VRNGARARDIAFVQKPFTRASLLRAVEQSLAAAPADRQARPGEPPRRPA
jgi:FixJ family two-component response regulator